MQSRECRSCGDLTPEDAFRKGRSDCFGVNSPIWKNGRKHGTRTSKRVRSTDFTLKKTSSYLGTPNRMMNVRTAVLRLELKELKLRKGKGYFVSWDIDCIEPKKGYAAILPCRVLVWNTAR